MDFNRPDLNNVNSDVVQYIEALEAELVRLRKVGTRSRPKVKEAEEDEDVFVSELEPEEPPTTIQVITRFRNWKADPAICIAPRRHGVLTWMHRR
jgi:hypothetical protein